MGAINVSAVRGGALRFGSKVALACPGLGDIRRGYERFYEDLYRLLRDELPMGLFQGGQDGPGIWLPRIGRKSILSRNLGTWEHRYKLEVLSFGAALLPPLLVFGYAVLHFSDYSLGAIGRLPRGLRPALLFTNGVLTSPPSYQAFEYIHEVNPVQHRRALNHGIPEERLFFIPHGVDTGAFTPVSDEERAALRRTYGIPPSADVILSVGDLGDDSPKRMEWVIDEVASLDGDPHLLVVGDQDRTSPALLNRARQRLGSRFHMLTLPSNAMPLAYALADVFVLASLHEGFGIVLIEAMASGLPIVTHHDAVRTWIVGSGGTTTDTREPGNLAAEIRFYLDNEGQGRRRGREARIRAAKMFDWKVLLPQYKEMYRTCVESR